MTKSELMHQIEELDSMHFVEKVARLNALKAEHGDLVDRAFLAHMEKNVAHEWQRVAHHYNEKDAKNFVNIQWEHICQSGGFEFTIESINPNTLSDGEDLGFKVICTKCPLAEMATAIGAQHWGYLAYCSQSHNAAKSFSPNIQFERHKTLMQGHSYCDHTYFNQID